MNKADFIERLKHLADRMRKEAMDYAYERGDLAIGKERAFDDSADMVDELIGELENE